MRQDPLGPPIYWLLPRQATFNVERELTSRSGMGAFCRVRVFSFEQFGRAVFEDCGGSAIPEVTPLGRRMIIGHLLRQNRPKLRFYSNVARQPGLASELDATFTEFEQAGKTLADLDAVIADISESNAADLELATLLDKLRDARLLYDAYSHYLGQDRLDQHGRMLQVESSLSRCSLLKGARIYVDCFLDFTEFERRTLVAAAKAGAAVEITLLMDPRSPMLQNPHTNPDEMSLFRRTEETYRRLHAAFTAENVSINELIRLSRQSAILPPLPPGEGRGEGWTQALSSIEADLFEDNHRLVSDPEGLELIEAPTRAAEVDAAARKIQSLIMQGTRFREIVVLVRELGKYESLIHSSFTEHRIPFFLDRRRSASHHPLLEFLRSAFAIARNDWPHDAVMTLVRTGLAGTELYDADGLENYMLARRIHGAEGWEAPQPWDYRNPAVRAEDEYGAAVATGPDQADLLRRGLLEKLMPLILRLRGDQPATVRDYAQEIFATLNRFGVRTTLSNWVTKSRESEDVERAAEHEQVWRNLVDLFDQLVDLLGDERLTPAEFQDVLESGLESFDLAIAPPTVDQVLVGQVDRTRTGIVKTAIVLGLNDGEFPAKASGSSILSDHDRRSLRVRRIDLGPGNAQRLLDERLLAYIAFTRASERLIVCRPISDENGRPAEPSPFWRRLIELFPSVRATQLVPFHRPEPGDIATPRQLVTLLLRWARGNPDPITAEPQSAWPALYQWLATSAGRDDVIKTLRDQAWPSLSYSNDAALSVDVARELFRSPLRASVSQLETFAACPFRHFVKYALGLRQRERQEVTVQDLGRFYHDLLEGALRDVLRRRAEGDRSARLEQAVDQFVADMGGSVRGQMMLDGARHRYLLDRTRRTTRRIAIAQRELLKRGSFRPSQVGVTFGPAGNLPALHMETKTGELFLEGKIDRIDRMDDGDDFAVIDYRLGPARLPVPMVPHGLSLQLLTYLLVLEADGQRTSGKVPRAAAAFYLQLVRKVEDVKHPDESTDPSDPKWHLKLKPRGIFDRRALPSLDKKLQTGWSDTVHAFIRQDGTLGHPNSTDALESLDFRALLELARTKLSELADGILSGTVKIAPYRLNDKSPCATCEYHSVCRFDPTINRYNFLQPISRSDVLSAARGGDGSKP
jgi:ATP-dependent helicase/nuclease subunit B